MTSLRLRIFAHHVHQIASTPAPAEFALSTCENGKTYNIRITKSQQHGPEWDTVYINGRHSWQSGCRCCYFRRFDSGGTSNHSPR